MLWCGLPGGRDSDASTSLTDYRIHDNQTIRRAEFMLRGRLTVHRTASHTQLDGCARARRRSRRYVLGRLGHIAYERGEMASARDLFSAAGCHLDGVGIVSSPWHRRPASSRGITAVLAQTARRRAPENTICWRSERTALRVVLDSPRHPVAVAFRSLVARGL